MKDDKSVLSSIIEFTFFNKSSFDNSSNFLNFQIKYSLKYLDV